MANAAIVGQGRFELFDCRLQDEAARSGGAIDDVAIGLGVLGIERAPVEEGHGNTVSRLHEPPGPSGSPTTWLPLLGLVPAWGLAVHVSETVGRRCAFSICRNGSTRSRSSSR